MTTRWTDNDIVDEINWVAKEANALKAEAVREGSERVTEFIARKRALLKYVEQERTSRGML